MVCSTNFCVTTTLTFSLFTLGSNPLVECFNQTFKNKMYKYFMAKNTLTYINVLPELVSSYNNTYHQSIKMKLRQMTKANEAQVWDTLYGDDVRKPVRFKFQVGDRVRIIKVKRMFEKSYLILQKKVLLFTSEWIVKCPFIN